MFNAWDHDFLWLAQQWGQRKSKDPSTKIGAVIAQGKKIISMGYNGFPEGLRDDYAMLADRPVKLERTVHGEINAILFAEGRQRGGTLYTAPFPPCVSCAPVIINAGIRRVVSFPSIPRWSESTDKAARMFAEAGIEQWIVDNGLPRQLPMEYGERPERYVGPEEGPMVPRDTMQLGGSTLR